MGYRSDVRIMTTKKGFKELEKYVKNYLKEKGYKGINMLDDLDLNKETKYAKYIGWDSVKWYEFSDDYSDVQAIMEGLSYLSDNNYSYRFARIGEDYDDYEERYFESDKESEQDLEYPCLIREFDDNYVIKNMERID